MAILNSYHRITDLTPWTLLRTSGQTAARFWRATSAGIALVSLLALPAGAPAAEMTPQVNLARVTRLYAEAHTQYTQAPTNPAVALNYLRACFDWADATTDKAQRAQMAQAGITAGRQLLQSHPDLGPAHYYLALNLGELARTESIGALKLVREMEPELREAKRLDPNFDYAGPDRALGLLYRDAPGWPVSIGSHSKARQYLQQAVELSPDYPENWISLLETYLKWGDKKAVAAKFGTVEQVLTAARRKFIGEAWAALWQDWDRSWAKIKAQMEGPTARQQSPRMKK